MKNQGRWEAKSYRVPCVFLELRQILVLSGYRRDAHVYVSGRTRSPVSVVFVCCRRHLPLEFDLSLVLGHFVPERVATYPSYEVLVDVELRLDCALLGEYVVRSDF